LNQGLALRVKKRAQNCINSESTAFYDARRWGGVAKASAFGGRANANVLISNAEIGATPAGGFTVIPPLIDLITGITGTFQYMN
jgi:hypothetical protein